MYVLFLAKYLYFLIKLFEPLHFMGGVTFAIKLLHALQEFFPAINVKSIMYCCPLSLSSEAQALSQIVP